MIAVASAPHPMDAEDRWRGLRRWRGDNAEAPEATHGVAPGLPAIGLRSSGGIW